MTEDDKRLISWALRAYAVQCENSPLLKYTPGGCSRDAKRARELADQFYPYSWLGVTYSTSGDAVYSKFPKDR